MLKYALLAGAMMISVPALAQDAQGAVQAAPGRTPVPTQSDPQTAPAQASTVAPAQAAPADTAQSATPVAPATPDAQAAQAQPATPDAAPVQSADAIAQPQAAGGDQVAQVVNSEFPTYDKDSNGALSEPEFSAWMVALKTASDPSTKATDPATAKWVDAAFAQADTDKNKAVSKQELTGFLSQGASASAGGR